MVKKKQAIMKTDKNVVTNEVAKPVPSSIKSEEMSILDLHEKTKKEQLKNDDITKPIVQESSHKMYRPGFHGGTREYLTNCTTMQHTLVSGRYSPIEHFVKDQRVKIPDKYGSKQMIHFQGLMNTSSTEESNLMPLDENSLREHVYDFAKDAGGHVYYGISSDGIVCGLNISKRLKNKVRKTVKKKIMSIMFDQILGTWNLVVYLKRIKSKIRKYIPNLYVIGIYVPPLPRAARCDSDPLSGYGSLEQTPTSQLASISFNHSPEGKIENIRLLDQDKLIKGQKLKVLTKKLSQETVKYKILKDDELSSTQNSVAHLITLEINELLAYVSAFANHHGGELYYGVSSDGTVCGEMMLEIDIEEIHEKVEKEIASMVWPQPADIHKVREITFLHVEDENEDDLRRSRYVIKISVHPCSGWVFVQEPESYHVLENNVEKLRFSTWSACLQDSTTDVLHMTATIDFEDGEKAFDRLFLPTDYQTFLKGLDWVESFKIVDANEECNEPRHLEIVCKLGKVPCTADIVDFFGEEILPFITYQECSKREWFETNIFDENSDMKYEDELASLSWVEDFYIGVTSEPEKSWQIYITCAENKVPSMVKLKELFGVDIASFVDFIQERVDEDSEGNEESLPSSRYLRGPISGDELFVPEGEGGYGAIGVLTAANEKHYATTCYHVCFKEKFPITDIKKGHEILKKDCANESQGCQGATCLYTIEENRTLLGRFCHGLYDDNHDIALVELESSLNCSDMVKFLERKGIRPGLADQKEVREMFYDKKALPVERVSPVPRKGILFGVHGMRRCPRNKRCYRIKGTGRRSFASEGDSGSFVYLVYGEENIPFAYVCMVFPESDKNVYYCRNLSASTNELIKRSDDLKKIKPCFTDHKSENEISSNIVT